MIRLAYWRLRDWLWMRHLPIEQRRALRSLRVIVATELDRITLERTA